VEALGVLLMVVGLVLIIMTWTETTGQVLALLFGGTKQ
jgi:hypothetical protein